LSLKHPPETTHPSARISCAASTDIHGMVPAATRPLERTAAAERRAAFPFRFPRDTRRLGGRFTVEENAKRLQRLFLFERCVAHGLGSWTLTIPDFEVKVETGRHIFWHMDAARQLRQRLTEQECRLEQIDGFRDPDIEALIEEALSAADSPELLAGMHHVIGRALQTAYRRHIEDTCPIADAPTIRVLRQILVDYEGMLEWADLAVAAYEHASDGARLATWRFHLEAVLQAIGGVSGTEQPTSMPESLRARQQPYVRGSIPCRDARFITFTNTGSYDAFDGTLRHELETYAYDRLTFIRAQRDEIDAIEAFGTFLWDLRFRNFDAELALARITWDETRHTELGHRSMQIMGYDPFELPNRLTSSTCRGPMEPAVAMAEINLFGEVGVMKSIPGMIANAQKHGDGLLSHVSDFIRSDERTHVRNGQRILAIATSLDLPALVLETRKAFTRCLVELGAIETGGDPGFILSREDIEHLVGE